MYKPPVNTNRVRAIKTKFENNENVNIIERKVQPVLARQMSDPVKVNIKRSPAFRNDKVFQRNGSQVLCRARSTENRTKNCDTTTPTKKQNFTNLRKRFDSQEDLTKPPQTLRERSNTSAEITLNRKCFDSHENLNNTPNKSPNIIKNIDIPIGYDNINRTPNKSKNINAKEETFSYKNINNTCKKPTNITTIIIPKDETIGCQNLNNSPNKSPTIKSIEIPKDEIRYENIAMLYTEPIPKSLRIKQNNFNDIHNISTLKISDKPSTKTDDIHSKLNALTDTLKTALKKPLPQGPAPKKPPRTFLHSPQSQLKLNGKFEKELNLSLQKVIDTKKPRGDPKYMLDKLESALKNNKIRLKRQAKIDYTSEEDNVEEKEKNSRFNLNCLSLSCSNAAYEAVGSRSNFFVDGKEEELVYAEPFVFPADAKSGTDSEGDKKNNRNSLYYMSSPVTATNGTTLFDTSMEDQGLNHSDTGDTSSLSTPTQSDIDSSTSDEGRPISKIKDLIKSFEDKNGKMSPNMENRVDMLGKQLRQTLDRSFRESAAESPSNGTHSERSSVEGDTSDAMVGKFATYVKTIRLFSQSRRKCDGRHLFHCSLLVGLNGKAPYVKFQFPQDVEIPVKIEELIFPDAADSTIDCSVKAQNYSIVITSDSGERIYGYCRRVLPENSATCLPLAYCILSKHRAPRFYRKILEELESRHGIPDKIRDVLLNEFYYHRFPSPGESVRISLVEVNKYLTETTVLEVGNCDNNKENVGIDLTAYTVVNGQGGYGTLNKKNNGEYYNKRNGVIFHNGIVPPDLVDELNEDLTSISTPTELVITLHQDARYKEKDLEELCTTLSINILLKVFASLLLERKVIFISCLLAKLSTCIEAIQNMLYPFSWPHTLIPVVPKELWEIVEAPTPVICGTLSVSVVNDYIIEDAIVVDLDAGEILMEVGDEGKILPCSLLKEFKDGMSLASSTSKENESGYNVLLSDAFLRIFIHSCGHYKDFIKEGSFQKEEFIQFPKRKNVRRFLKWFTETTMFYTFIETVLSDPSSFKIFDKRIQIYGSQDAILILEKMKDWKKEKSSTLFF